MVILCGQDGRTSPGYEALPFESVTGAGHGAGGVGGCAAGRSSPVRAVRSPVARGQITVMLAPPAGEAPTVQRPPVARTTASPIARPSPAPPGVLLARWKRSKTWAR